MDTAVCLKIDLRYGIQRSNPFALPSDGERVAS